MTVYDVARKAGVSIATISRVVNNSPLVKEATRVKIKKLIDKLGYRPSVLAQRLSNQKTNTLGLVIPQLSQLFSSYYFLEILRGIEGEAYNRNYGLYLHVPREEKKFDYIQLLEEKRVDALILVALSLNDSGLSGLEKMKNRAVLVGCYSKTLPSIDVDNETAAFGAVEHFIGHGRKKIAILNGLLDGVDGRDRYQGYLKALKKHGIAVVPEWILDGQYDQQRAYDLVVNLIRSRQVPDALFAANDLMALGAMHALRDCRLRVPDDVAVIGFDDMPSSAYVDPALSTFRQPLLEMGRKAVGLVLKSLESKSHQVKKEIMPAEFVVRRSCGCGIGSSIKPRLGVDDVPFGESARQGSVKSPRKNLRERSYEN